MGKQKSLDLLNKKWMIEFKLEIISVKKQYKLVTLASSTNWKKVIIYNNNSKCMIKFKKIGAD